MGFTVPAAYGRGLFLGKGLLPLQTPINVVAGAPIPCSKFQGDTRSPEGAFRTCSCESLNALPGSSICSHVVRSCALHLQTMIPLLMPHPLPASYSASGAHNAPLRYGIGQRLIVVAH